jgi:hypothetical protein
MALGGAAEEIGMGFARLASVKRPRFRVNSPKSVYKRAISIDKACIM